MLEGVTRGFYGVELTEIAQQLGGELEKWGSRPFAEAAVLFVDGPHEGEKTEIRIFFSDHYVAVFRKHNSPVPSDMDAVFYNIDTILYSSWADGGPGVEFRKKEPKKCIRIFSSGKIRIEV